MYVMLYRVCLRRGSLYQGSSDITAFFSNDEEQPLPRQRKQSDFALPRGPVPVIVFRRVRGDKDRNGDYAIVPFPNFPLRPEFIPSDCQVCVDVWTDQQGHRKLFFNRVKEKNGTLVYKKAGL